MHFKKYNVIFCSDIGQKHIGTDTQRGIIQILKDETPNLMYKYPWTGIIITSRDNIFSEIIRIDLYGYEIKETGTKTITKFLKSREWEHLWKKWSY